MADLTRPGLAARVRRLLNAEEPRQIRWLRRTWRNQMADITDQELEDAIAAGEVPPDWARRFADRYAEYVNERLAPRWGIIGVAAIREVSGALSLLDVEHDFGLVRARIDQWIANHGAELVTNFSRAQMQALRAILRRHTVEQPLGQDELVRLMRPVVGLTHRQANAVANLRAALEEEGDLTDTQILRAVERQAARYRTIRARRIARTELAYAYNRGTQFAVEDVAHSGVFDQPVRRIWRTQADERVCPICGPMDGVEVALDEEFGTDLGRILTPPVHPHCRCVVLYEA